MEMRNDNIYVYIFVMVYDTHFCTVSKYFLSFILFTAIDEMPEEKCLTYLTIKVNVYH